MKSCCYNGRKKGYLCANGDEPVEGKEEFIEQKKEEVVMHLILFHSFLLCLLLRLKLFRKSPFFLLIF